MKHDAEQYWRLSYPDWLRFATATGLSCLQRGKLPHKAWMGASERARVSTSVEERADIDIPDRAAPIMARDDVRLEDASPLPRAVVDIRAGGLPPRTHMSVVPLSRLPARDLGGCAMPGLTGKHQTSPASSSTPAELAPTRNAASADKPALVPGLAGGFRQLGSLGGGAHDGHSAPRGGQAPQLFEVTSTAPTKPAASSNRLRSDTAIVRLGTGDRRSFVPHPRDHSVPPGGGVPAGAVGGAAPNATRRKPVPAGPMILDAAGPPRTDFEASQRIEVGTDTEQPGGAATSVASTPIGGDVYLDGALMGRWVARTLTAAASRQPSSGSTFDPTRTRLPAGTMIGI